tara:strand:+ start:5975 stop:6355 length:381 start_codon:yes stop_codon:yes gene_type:complete
MSSISRQKYSNVKRLKNSEDTVSLQLKKQLMSAEKNSDEFYKKLKEQLSDTSIWPSEYLFKFIVPSDKEKILAIQDIFNNTGAVIQTKESRNGKYTSLSINVRMKNPDAVITKYKEVALVEGVISL